MPVTDWFDLAADRVTRKIEVQLRDSNVFARVNLLAKRGDITPTHAHPFGHTVLCGRGEIGLSKVTDDKVEMARLRAGMGAYIAAGIEHTMVALRDDSGFACIFPHRNCAGDIVPEWTGWGPGQGVPVPDDDPRVTGKTIVVLTSEWLVWSAGEVLDVTTSPPHDMPSHCYRFITVPDAPQNAFWDLIENHQSAFRADPGRILPVRNRRLDLAKLAQTMSYADLCAAKIDVELQEVAGE